MTNEPSDSNSTDPAGEGPGGGVLDQDVLDGRKGQVLRAIVEEYVGRAQPVGSKRIAESRDLGVSAATIRNDMGALERDGFIAQPHTSAGRIPTDLGYRYYVDHLAGDAPLPATARREVSDFFSHATRAMEDLLHDTSQLLARLTDHAAVVVGPLADVERIRSVQLVGLQERLVLAVVVLSDGVVQKEAIALDHELDEAGLAAASRWLDDLWRDRTLAEVAPPEPDDRVAPETAALLHAIGDTFARRGRGTPGEPLYVGGASRLAAEHDACTSAGIAARVLELLEQHVVMVGVMRELLGPGLTIRIGAENERDDLRECSIILAPYLVEGATAGTIGVLGPTRMDYRQASAAVATVSANLGRQLTA